MNNLLSLEELAEQIRVPIAWLREEDEAGRLPHLDAGGMFLFNPVLVAESLASRATKYRKQEGDDNE